MLCDVVLCVLWCKRRAGDVVGMRRVRSEMWIRERGFRGYGRWEDGGVHTGSFCIRNKTHTDPQLSGCEWVS